MAVDAASGLDGVETVHVRAGHVLAEVTRVVETDWTAESVFPVGVELRRSHDERPLRAGDRVTLDVVLEDGYRIGDLVHVALSPCLDWIECGGRVKRFSLDFAGRDALSVPLVVTGPIDAAERFAPCVRKMFEEERVSSPGFVAVVG